MIKMQTKKSLGLPREARAKWGQNFLRDRGILKKIADFAQIEKEDTVVEVGPGEGTLTELLLERAKKVIAIEKDEKLVEFLKEKFAKEIKEEKLKIIAGDILKVSEGVFEMPRSQKTPFDTYKVVGNIPYYITGAIFKKFLEPKNQPSSITFVVQKEVAERIMGSHFAKASRDKKESILSISIKVYGTPEFGGVIKAGSFCPKPKVDSAIIAIRNISKSRFPRSDLKKCPKGQTLGISEVKFFKILKAGFAHKRKLLIKNLILSQIRVSRTFLDMLKMKEIFEKCGISEKARAENLKVENWVCLTKELV